MCVLCYVMCGEILPSCVSMMLNDTLEAVIVELEEEKKYVLVLVSDTERPRDRVGSKKRNSMTSDNSFFLKEA